jgi:pimeloyl-ACP methyl ester carboxylesterase
MPRIVASHGLGDSATTWDAVVEYLGAEGVDVDTWDLSGHGDAAAPDLPYGVDVAMGQLREVIAAGPSPVVLMGHSFGGYLSLRYVLAHPDQVVGLVLVATGPGFRSDEKRADWNRYLDKAASKMDIAPGVEEVARQYDSTVIDGLSAIEIPTLVISGDRDTRFHAGGDHVAARIPGARHDLISDAGHHPHVDAPAEVGRRILEMMSAP